MISADAMERIEEQAFNKFVDVGKASRIEDDFVEGEIPVWTDADDYYMTSAKCTIPGAVIKDWLYDDFRTNVEKYLHACGYRAISNMVDPNDIPSPIYYFEYCMDIYDDIVDYFWDYIYPDKQQQYFEDHAERSYD